MQSDEGVSDNSEIFVQDMFAEIARQNDKYGITFDEDLAWLFSEESSDTYTWLCAAKLYISSGLVFSKIRLRLLASVTSP